MKTYYVTFGQKYRYEPHPKWTNTKTQYVHPDGYWKVSAIDLESAIEKVFNVLEQYWSNIYQDEPKKKMFPLRVIGEII